MRRWIRRFLTLGLLGGGTAAALKLKGGRSKKDEPLGSAEWPPMRPVVAPRPPSTESESTPSSPTSATSPASSGTVEAGDTAAVHGFLDGTAAAVVGQNWVAPSDGVCPSDHPVKANDDSGIYHVPGGRFYERTIAERCYTTPDAASADGYRPAKV